MRGVSKSELNLLITVPGKPRALNVCTCIRNLTGLNPMQRYTVYYLGVIALLILVIPCINYQQVSVRSCSPPHEGIQLTLECRKLVFIF